MRRGTHGRRTLVSTVVASIVLSLILGTLFFRVAFMERNDAGNVPGNGVTPTAIVSHSSLQASKPLSEEATPQEMIETGGHEVPTSADRHVTHAGKPVEHRYLMVGNSFGRHSNQLVSITAAMAVAQATGRVLVLPDLAFGGRGGGGSVTTTPDSVYRLTPDTVQGQAVMCVDKGGCAIRSVDFAKLMQKHSIIDVGCITMRGVSQMPKSPKGVQPLKCGESAFVKFKKNYATFKKGLDQLSGHQVIFVPLAIYAANALEPHTSFAWRLFSPPPEIQHHLDSLRPAQKSVDCTVGPAVTRHVTIGVHLRNLEGSCSSRVGQYWSDTHNGAAAGKATLANLTLQCDMAPEYIRGFVPRDEDKKYCLSLYLADDGQRNGWGAAVQRAVLGSQQAWSLNRIANGQDDTATYAKALINRDLEAVRQAVKPSAFFVQGPISEVKGLTSMLVDFWTLVQADIFVGNQMSTLSVNVCRRRVAMGKPCDNFVWNS
jgi:hypothetical protein